MFFHNFKYRIKCIARDREMMFWTLVFPIILGTLFNMALSNISESENFEPIEMAIVKEGTYESKAQFLDIVNSVSDNKDDDQLFNVEYTSKEEAKYLLDNNNIEGYLYFDEDIKVVVKKSGINQTIIKSFVDEFEQTTSTIETIAKENPQALATMDFESTFERSNFITEVPISKNEANMEDNFFYALIAMTCMYGGLIGGNEISNLQANQSSKGSRIGIAPTHKLKLALSSISAATTFQVTIIGVLLVYLYVVLDANFSNQLGYILITCIVGSITGITYGTCISALIKKNEGVKIGILFGTTMLMSFLGGLMNNQVKYIVNSKIPIVNKLNPVNLIADSFYSLYYYDTLDRFYANISTLCAFSIIFGGITYLVLRRQKYASL